MSVLVGAAVIVAVILGGLFLLIYNNLIRVKNNVSRAWSDIDVLLQKRHDLIGNLVETVKGYMKYEKTLLVQVTELRTKWDGVKDNKDPNAKMSVSNQISGGLKTVFADVENYPDLKANQTFVQLQEALIQIENEIADRREFYNDTVNEYNIQITIVPYDIFAKLLKYQPMQFFKVAEGEDQPVKVNI